LNLLPTAAIASLEQRAVRDLLRRRMLLVRQRTTHLLSFQSLVARQTGQRIKSNHIKALEPEALLRQLGENVLHEVRLMGQTNLAMIQVLQTQIAQLEKTALAKAKLQPQFAKIQTIPGVGPILSLVIMLETWDISRFQSPSHYCSYCRTVKAHKISNQKKKGEANRRNGNRYLAWAFVEAAQFARRYSPEAHRWFERKTARTNQIVARKSLASKLAKATYYVMKNQEDFSTQKAFGC
jgi:transposase